MGQPDAGHDEPLWQKLGSYFHFRGAEEFLQQLGRGAETRAAFGCAIALASPLKLPTSAARSSDWRYRGALVRLRARG